MIENNKMQRHATRHLIYDSCVSVCVCVWIATKQVQFSRSNEADLIFYCQRQSINAINRHPSCCKHQLKGEGLGMLRACLIKLP